MVNHGDEIKYVFGTVLSTGTEEQRAASRITMRFWANMARSGDPNIDPSQDDMLPTWPRYFSGRAQTATLNITAAPSVAHSANTQGCAFFEENWDYLKICLPQNPTLPLNP